VHAENILRNVNCADQSTKCCLKITAHIRASSSSLDLATKIINEPSALNYTTVTQISNKAICKQAIQISVFFKSLCLFCAVYPPLSIHKVRFEPSFPTKLAQRFRTESEIRFFTHIKSSPETCLSCSLQQVCISKQCADAY